MSLKIVWTTSKNIVLLKKKFKMTYFKKNILRQQYIELI